MSKADRITEHDLLLPTLKILDSVPSGWMSTSGLIGELHKTLSPSSGDLEILDGRYDTKLSQIVRNMVSHKGSKKNIIKAGYVEYVARGLRITAEGKALLGT